jgi:hypothetical protein
MEKTNNPPINLEDIKEQLYEFFRLNFPTPGHLIAWINDDILEGKVKFHAWQAKIHSEDFSIEQIEKRTSGDPLELNIRAVNGSGKDEFVINPIVLHFLGCFKMSRVVLTTASGQQLKAQTEKYLSLYGNKLNAKLSNIFGLKEIFEFFTIQQRYIKCNFTDSECVLFATDEAGKAEGYHPLKSGGKFMILVNEGKTIIKEIWEALSRCNGFTHWVEVSSPGKPDGHFYENAISDRVNRKGEIAVKKIVVTAYDCPHLAGEGGNIEDYVNRLVEIYGSREHYMVKSMVDGDFSSNDEQVVVTYDKYNRLIRYQKNCEHIPESTNNAGLDLGFGGDEISLQVRNGNKHLGGNSLISKDVNIICDTIDKWLKNWGFIPTKGKINADAGGLGEPIISLLRGPSYGWKNIIPVKNNWVAGNENAYKNLGTEMWFTLEKLIAEQEIIIKDDDVLRKQLCNRYYKINTDNTSQLESKQQARSKGRPSPDRADAMVLCFHKYKTPAVRKTQEQKLKLLKELSGKLLMGAPTIKKLVEKQMDRHNANMYMQQNGIVNAAKRKSIMDKNALKLELNQALRSIYGNN